MMTGCAVFAPATRKKEWRWPSFIGVAVAAMVLMFGLQGCGGGSGGGGFFPPPVAGGGGGSGGDGSGGGNPVAPVDPATPVDMTNLYVSPTGNDQNPGTQAKPFATLKQAVSKATSDAQAGAGGLAPAGRTIFLDEGTHYLASTIVLGPELSGAPGKPFTITAVPGKKAVVSGARNLGVLAWTGPDGSGRWTAATDGTDFDDLYVNGERQIRARFPNFQPRDLSSTTKHFFNGSAAATAQARVARWHNPKGGYAHVMLNAEWGDIHYRINGKNADNTLNLSEGTGNNRMEQGPNWSVSFVENIFEELDAPQEWFHDVAAKKLYFIPKAGFDPTGAKVEVSGGADQGLVEQLIVLKGSEATPIHDVAIKGLTLTQTGNTFMKTTEPLLRSDWKVFRGGAIYIEGGKDLEIAGNDMYSMGGNAVFVSGYNRGVAVRGNEISDIGASAILFVGSPDAVRSPGFQYADRTSYADMDKTPGPKTNAYPSQSIAENNLIHDIGTREKQATGVEISMSSHITVRSNSIYGTPRAGINIGDGTWGGHVLEFNDVFDTVLETGDHGAFNSWGRDRYWGQLPPGNSGNANADLAAHPEMPYLDAMDPTTIRNNRFRGFAGSWDIDLDDGSSNYVIENNVLLQGGLKNREGFKRINRNNILVNNTFHAHVWFAKSLDHFEKNIVMGAYQPIGIGTGNNGELVDNNLLPTTAALKAAQALGWDANSKVSGDPMFADALNGDFTVAASSPALAVGFQNFAMDKFGVQDPRLKPRALKPIFDPANIQVVVLETPSDFLGAKVKSVETEGERSAAGLPSVAGVLVQSVLAGSDAANSGVLANDVFLQATVAGQVKDIVDSNDLNAALGAEAANGKLHVKVRRNNVMTEFDLLFPSLAVHNDDWTGIAYTSSWGRSTGRNPASGDFNFDVHYTQANGDAMSVTFNGTGIRVLAPVDTAAVQFSSALDGATAQAMTIPAVAVYKGQRTIYSVSGLPAGSHTLVLKKVSGAYFQIDRVDLTQ